MRPPPIRLLRTPRLQPAPPPAVAGLPLRFRETESAANTALRTCLSPRPASKRSPVPSRKTFIISVWIASAARMPDNTGPFALHRMDARAQGHYLLRRYASFLILIIALFGPAAPAQPSASSPPPSSQEPQAEPSSTLASMSAYVGRPVKSVELPGVPDSDRLLRMLPQKPGQPLDRDQVRESIRSLFATGRFADIQAEVTPSGDGVVLTFATSLNFFVGAVDVEGAPGHPSYNQIVNASKFQLGELHTQDKLERAFRNVRQLMQENGYYRARVTAESVSNAADQQVNILVHITAGEPAHVGEVKLTGHGTFSQGQFEDIARMHPADRVTASRITNSLQHLRKK